MLPVKTISTAALSGILMLGIQAGNVFADAAAVSQQTAVSVQTQPNTDSSSPPSTLQTQTGNESNTAASSGAANGVKLDSPGLVPGDFFYFVKTIVEEIRLDLTFNQANKAKLLADYAHERIAETNKLIQDGKYALAQKTIREALQNQQIALKLDQHAHAGTAHAGNTLSTQISKTNAGNTTNTGQSASNQSTNDSRNAGTGNTSAASQNQQIGNPAATNSPGAVQQSAQTSVQVEIGHNIEALAAALTHIKNPRAQQAILKNITKSFGHVSKQIDKINAGVAKFGNATPEGNASEDTNHEDSQKQKPDDAGENPDIVIQNTGSSSVQISVQSNAGTKEDGKKDASEDIKMNNKATLNTNANLGQLFNAGPKSDEDGQGDDADELKGQSDAHHGKADEPHGKANHRVSLKAKFQVKSEKARGGKPQAGQDDNQDEQD